MGELENFNPNEHQTDIPDHLCFKTGPDLNFLFKDSPEKRRGKLPITKNHVKGKKLMKKDAKTHGERERPLKRKSALIELSSPEFCHSLLLQQKVMRREASLIRGLTQNIGMDLDLFKTEALLKVNPEHKLETRRQFWTPPDYAEKDSWDCPSQKDTAVLKDYAKYQQEFLKRSASRDENLDRSCGTIQEIAFGTNFDLSNETVWEEQLKELEKLPEFCKLRSKENLLYYSDMQIFGMNTVQMYLKVPGSRTPGHQENNNFCSVNINVGPGVTEWFTVPFEYWKKIDRLCTERNKKFLEDSWWPDLDTLREHGIPVERFDQLPGDLVFLNIGCVHWVQAKSVCNNIAWNVGPMTAEQFDAAAERYEWNKIKRFPSLVPMKFLSWNLARNLDPTQLDKELFRSIKIALGKSMIQSFRILSYVEDLPDKAVCQVEVGTGKAMYCKICKEEIFNNYFIKSRARVYCFSCAKREDPELVRFKCLQEYGHDELMNWFDEFRRKRI